MDGDGVMVASVVMNLISLVGAVGAVTMAIRKNRHDLTTDERKQQREARDAMVEELQGLITAQRAEINSVNVKVDEQARQTAEAARKAAECEAARSRMEGRLDVLAGLMEEKGIRVPPWPPTPPQSPAGGS